MNHVLGALKATYNFFSGDAITLGATFVAFAVGLVLLKIAHAPYPLVAALFVLILVAGLIITLSREIAGRSRADA